MQLSVSLLPPPGRGEKFVLEWVEEDTEEEISLKREEDKRDKVFALERVEEETYQTKEPAHTSTEETPPSNLVIDIAMAIMLSDQRSQGADTKAPFRKLDKATVFVYILRVWSGWDPSPLFMELELSMPS